MSFAQREPRPITEEEHLMIEDADMEKNEFWYGAIYARPHPSIQHIDINGTLLCHVHRQLRGTPHRDYGSLLMVRTSPGALIAHPDLTVADEKDRFLPRENAVLLNPAALFEIVFGANPDTV